MFGQREKDEKGIRQRSFLERVPDVGLGDLHCFPVRARRFKVV